MLKKDYNFVFILIFGGSCNPNTEVLRPPLYVQQNVTYIDDVQFIADADEVITMEIDLGRLAIKKSSNKQIKDLANTIIKDGFLSKAEIRRLAVNRNIKLKDKISQQKQVHYNRFFNISEKAFDSLYVNYLLKEYRNNISMMEDEIARGKNKELKAWAEGQINIAWYHLRLSQFVQ